MRQPSHKWTLKDKRMGRRTGSTGPTVPITLGDDKGTTVKFNLVGPAEEAVRVEREGCLVRLPLLDPSECRKIIDVCDEFTDWDAQTDSVDRKTESQHLIYDMAKNHTDGVLLELCEALSKRVLDGVLGKHLGLRDLRLHWCFIRKYSADSRREFPVHRDSSAATVNILLSDPKDFTGAELYLLPQEHKSADTLSPSQFKKQFPESVLRQRYGVQYQQGEACMHLGKRMHGVLPLTTGFRYTLILMYLP